ncbi:hypothetical protein PAXINDRAFT_17377 [Paxillus involutus ATCC 200175]|uniref:Uncharacterized protein n=1 Tax=Paxillus involutus ATCC 200175 TaxID=664439 RepID=A0A0C9T1D7_PAXIN|nr:hypothetical protein PAXINDRAFT_17377 [Paxillus involutus ATCC 200175]
MSSSANALSRVVTRGKAAIYLLRRIFRYGHSYRGTGTKVTLSTHIFYYARRRI